MLAKLVQSGGSFTVENFFSKSAGVEFDLKTVPEVVGLPEKCPEADGHVRCDGAFAVDDFVDGAGRYTDGSRHRVLGNARGLKVFFEDKFIVADGAVNRAVGHPTENDAPLGIDADGVHSRVLVLQNSFREGLRGQISCGT